MDYKLTLQGNNDELRSVLEAVQALPAAKEPVIQKATFAANGTYAAPEGVDGYSPVVVQVPAPKLQTRYITPNAAGQTVSPASGYDGLKKVVLYGDTNLVPDNIKSGVSIFGVEGSFQGSSGGGAGQEYQVTFNDYYGWDQGNMQSTIYTADGPVEVDATYGAPTITFKGSQLIYWPSTFSSAGCVASGCVEVVTQGYDSYSGGMFSVLRVSGDQTTGDVMRVN